MKLKIERNLTRGTVTLISPQQIFLRPQLSCDLFILLLYTIRRESGHTLIRYEEKCGSVGNVHNAVMQ